MIEKKAATLAETMNEDAMDELLEKIGSYLQALDPWDLNPVVKAQVDALGIYAKSSSRIKIEEVYGLYSDRENLILWCGTFYNRHPFALEELNTPVEGVFEEPISSIQYLQLDQLLLHARLMRTINFASP